jgi:hydroxymethylpyrimidine pyrophosphatase-like HAD family hydrolase
LDLDGTLLGRGGSLLHDGEGHVSLEGARAIQTCLRAGVEVVLMSGRPRDQVAWGAQLFGQNAYIFEAGACVVLDGEEHWLTAAAPARSQGQDELTVAEQIERGGAPALLLSRYRGRLEYHHPWHRGRQASHLFRGLLDTAEANRLLAERGHEGVRLLEGGVLTRRPPALTALAQVHLYHLVPASVSKAAAVLFHRGARGYTRAQTFAVGNSRADAECAVDVGAFWFVANALARDSGLSAVAAHYGNVHVTDAAYGAGVYEAVVKTLIEQR